MSNVNKNYTEKELKGMSNEDLARLGTELDEVTVAYRKERFPLDGDPEEKRAVRNVGFWFTLAIVFGVAFLAVYLFWPWEYKGLGEAGKWVYTFYTPLLGLTMGLSILSMSIGIVQYQKKFIPSEISVQRRHDGGSPEVDRATLAALLNDSWQTSTLGRRKVLKGLMGTSAALAGLAIIFPLGGMIKNPWKKKEGALDYHGDGTLWTSGWTQIEDGKKVYLGRDTSAIAEKHGEHYSTTGVTRLVRMRPEDLSAAAMETVFPLCEEDVNDGADYDSARDVYEMHMHSIHGPRNAVMLIRARQLALHRSYEGE